MGVEVPSNPINRKEQYLAKIAGQAVEIPAEPLTREEAYLDEIAKNGSGGGGTTNYNSLSNKPQIAGTTLSGNKSLSDLGIASAQSVENITNGESINNFAGVETALGNKQNTLTAGDYVVIENDKISVSKLKQGKLDLYSYEFVTTDASHTPKVKVIKKVNGETISETVYDEFQAANWMTFDNIIRFRYDASDSYKWKYQCLVTSNEHTKDTVISWFWNQTVDYTETFDVGSSAITDLVTKGDMTDALESKQDAYETITYAQWQALTPAQQAAKDYYISDYPSSVLTAGNISYDNTTSGMAANKVQGAIDELKSETDKQKLVYVSVSNTGNDYTNLQNVLNEIKRLNIPSDTLVPIYLYIPGWDICFGYAIRKNAFDKDQYKIRLSNSTVRSYIINDMLNGVKISHIDYTEYTM